MSQGFLMGLDLGGGSARCLLLELASGQLHSASRRFAAQPHAGIPMGSVFDAAATWAAITS